MIAPAPIAAASQLAVLVAGSPLLVGLMCQVRARLHGRAGAGLTQPWRELRKLLRKESITPVGSGLAFRLAPLLLLDSTCVVAVLVPLATTVSPFRAHADLIVMVGLLALGTVVLALAALDTGTAFGGMGASRAMTIAALVEPTILLSIVALSIRAGSTNLAVIVTSGVADPLRLASPASLLACVALAVVTLAETGRLPVDNPATHLELTMVHEAMLLEYAGRDLALLKLASAMRLSLLLGLLAALFAPWGIATTASLAALALGLVLLVAKVAVLGVVLAAGEVLLAKVRLFRVPELLAGSFLLALLSVAVSFFLTGK